MLRRLLPILLILPLLAPLTLPAPAAAQEDPLEGFSDPVRQLNRLLPRASEDERSDLILGEALAETDAAPASVRALDLVALLVPDDPEWSDAVAWAAAEAQQAALDALQDATERREDRAFALPYGEDAPAELRRAGFWVELEDGKTYRPIFRYVDGIDRLRALAWIEANRLADDGEHMDAAQTLVAMVRLGRQLADRPFATEAAYGYALMLSSLEQLRDLSYRNPGLFDERRARRVIRLLEDRTLEIERLRLPEGGEIAAKHAVLDTFERLGAPRASQLAAALDDPASAGGLSSHAGYYETLDQLDAVFANWRLRWPLSPYDIVMARPSTSLMMDADRFRLVRQIAGPVDVIFELRRRVRAALAGTKLGIGVMGYQETYGSWPNPLVAIRPAFTREIDVDPYDPRQVTLMRYFVPIRDQQFGAREAPRPHEIRVQFRPDDDLAGRLAAVQSAVAFTDRDAFASIKSFVAAVTEFGLELRNVDELIDELSDEQISRLVPSHLGPRVANLGSEELRDFALVMARTALAFPEWPELRERFGSGDDRSRSRRRGRRGGGGDEIPADLGEMAPIRALAAAQSRVGAPLAARLSRLDDGRTTTFTISLDESHFVLYSVGEDAVADFARESGLGGADLLYWPPVLTLAREQLGN